MSRTAKTPSRPAGLRSIPQRLGILGLLTGLLIGSAAVLAGPAAADVNAITLSVSADGQAPFDSVDSTASNGKVRTNDTLTYAWSYSSSVAAAGSVAFVQTLTTSALIRFDQSNIQQCTGAGGGTVSSDGHTLTCSVLVDASGVGSVPITVTPPGTVPNGTTIGSSLTANNAALSGGSTTTTVVGQPQLNLQANLYGTAVTTSVNGASGNGFVYTMAITQAAGAKGTELAAGALTFTMDLSRISANAALVAGSCGPNNRQGSGLPYGAIGIMSGATATNSVVDSGTISCSQTGRIVTVSITGANLTGSSNPTAGAQGSTLSTTLTYLVSGILTVFVPSTDIPATIQPTMQYRGFDPSSATGQSNFGAGYEPGGEPTAASCTYVADNSTRTNDNCYSTVFSPRSAGYGGYFWTLDTSSGVPPGAGTTGTAGDGVVSAGEKFFDRLAVYSTSGPSLVGPAICDKWNPAELHILGSGRAYKSAATLTPADYTVQYAALTMTDDAARRSTSCATGTWYDSIEAAGGVGAVSAVRFQYPGTVANGEYLLFYPQFETQPNTVGTIVASFDSARLGASESWSPSYYVRETNSPNYTGNRLTVSDGRLRVGQSNSLATQSLAAGGSVTYSLAPAVTRNTTATTPIGGVTVTDTLPNCARYEAGTASVPVEQVAAMNGADGTPCTGDAGETGPTLVFKLGSILPGTTIPPITFKATILKIAPDSSTATNAVVISSDAAVAIDLAKRTAAAAFTVRNQTQFAVSETTTTPQISGNDPVLLILAYRNLSGLTVPTLTLITELPYSADAKGSVFTGTLTYTGITLPGNTVALCTSDPHGTISTDPASSANSYTSTCNATTTALKLTVSNLVNSAIDKATITLTPAGNATGDKYVNTASGTYVPSGSSTPVALPATERTEITVVSSTITGRVWKDTNNDGLRQATETGFGSIPVALTGTNDLGAAVSKTATSAADGSYSIGGLRGGNYLITFAAGAPPAGAAFSPQKVGSDRSIDSDGKQTTGVTDPIAIGSGAMISGIDQGISYLAPTVTTTSSAATVGFTESVTLTATVPAVVTGTVTFTDGVVSGPSTGQTVTLGTGTISNGTASWTGPLPAYGKNMLRAQYPGDGTYPAASSTTTVVENTAGASALLISQFRQSGPTGPTDQFVQLTNTGAFPIPLAGVIVQPADSGPITLPTTAPALPVGHAYLLTGAGYSLAAVAASDLTIPALGTAGGIRVQFPDTAGTIADAAGSTPGFTTGTALLAISGQPTDQHAWVRLAQLGPLVNSRNNATDFALVSTTAAPVGGVPSLLGAPSPRGTGSAIDRTRQLTSSLLDGSVAAGLTPNRTVLPGTPGSLTVRRVITNTTTETIQLAKVRVVSLSEVNGPLHPGLSPVRTAALRLINPPTTTSSFQVAGQPVVVQNLSLDGPNTGAPGGGINSTLTVPLPSGGLPPGQSVPVAFTFAIDGGGTFWFVYAVEA